MTKIHVELGCGNNRRDIDGWLNFGVDLYEGEFVDHICNLGFENLPFDTSTVHLVQAYDVLEHIPKCVWSDLNNFKRLTPFIHLMNEIHRILDVGGKFIMETPFSDPAFYRDPTHVSRLSEDWYSYFTQKTLYHEQGTTTAMFRHEFTNFRKYLWSDKDIMHTVLTAI